MAEQGGRIEVAQRARLWLTFHPQQLGLLAFSHSVRGGISDSYSRYRKETIIRDGDGVRGVARPSGRAGDLLPPRLLPPNIICNLIWNNVLRTSNGNSISTIFIKTSGGKPQPMAALTPEGTSRTTSALVPRALSSRYLSSYFSRASGGGTRS